MANPVQFLSQVRAEAAKITWPTRREVVTTTIMVLIMASRNACLPITSEPIACVASLPPASAQRRAKSAFSLRNP